MPKTSNSPDTAAEQASHEQASHEQASHEQASQEQYEQNAVEIQGVNKIFLPGSASQVIALTDIDLSIAPGSFTTLIGPSGCGKSTLLRLVAGLIEPTEGSVSVNGKTANQARKDRDYGMAFQTASLFDWRTVQRPRRRRAPPHQGAAGRSCRHRQAHGYDAASLS